MQYDVKTPSEYLDTIDNDWRKEKLHQLRNIIKSKAPDLKEGIEYKMLSYGNELGSIFHLNAQKNHVGLYIGDAKKIDIDGDLLSGLDVGKGCIRFKKSNIIADTKIDEFIERAIAFWKDDKDIGC